MANDVRTPHSILGTLGKGLSAIAGVLIAGFWLAGLFGTPRSPYLGIVAYLVLPAFLVFGLLLIPLGAYLSTRATRRAARPGGKMLELPIIDLNKETTRKKVLAFVVITAVNFILLAVATRQGLQILDEPTFCGTTCHSVTGPEFSAFKRSPHAKLRCVDCHIGSGASWIDRSKLLGAWQMISVAFDLYPRPIPTPIRHLRPTRESCEACHSAVGSAGDRLVMRTAYGNDENATETKTLVLLHLGGQDSPAGSPTGIHAHIAPGVKVRYLADPDRQVITTVESILPNGEVHRFRTKESPTKDPATDAWFTMDCVDCHNRPSHDFRMPTSEVDLAISNGRFDRSLPYLRREAVEALMAEYPTPAQAKVQIHEKLVAFYRGLDPASYDRRQAAIEAMAASLADLYDRNVWPGMRITWGTYPSQAGHTEAEGCFRCHDEKHVAQDGRTISHSCDLCHTVLSSSEGKMDLRRTLMR